MELKKIIITFILFFNSFVFSQRVNGFGGFSVFLNRSLDKSLLVSINCGTEIKINDNFKPELEFNYFIGSLPDKTNEDENGFEIDRLVRVISAFNVSLNPKFVFGNIESNIRFQISPKFNLTKVFARETLFIFDKSNLQYINTESDKASVIKYSMGICLGFIINLADNKSQSIALNLLYNNIDLGNALSDLKSGNTNIHTHQSIGIGIVYYFGLFKTNKNNLKKI